MNRLQLALTLLMSNLMLTAQNNLSKVHPSVWQTVQNGKVEVIIVFKEQPDLSAAIRLSSKEEKGLYVANILQANAQRSQARVKKVLETQHLDYQSLWIVNAIYTKADVAFIQQLAQREEVAQILNNPVSKRDMPDVRDPVALSERNMPKLAWGVQKIQADSVWALGFKGQNVVIAGEDTGYDWTHPAIKTKYRGWNGVTANHSYNWYDAIHADSTKSGNPCGYDIKVPCDDDRHGTHTMGTMVGANDTLIMGVAPDAKWIGARNMDRGFGTLQSYVECFQFFLAPTDTAKKNPDPRKAPHIINNSWYCSREEGCNESNFNVLEQAMNACRAAGIVVVVSAGNSGSACSTVTGPPAFFNKAFSIGATRSDDTIANFSSRGPVTIDGSGRMKPNVSAPGVRILSTVTGGGLQELSGTSMAGPHVAGVVALMISANPALAGQVDTIERMIEMTAKPMTTTQNCGTVAGTQVPNHTYGFGRIDAFAAVKKALAYKKTSSTIDKHAVVKVFPNPFSSELTFYTDMNDDIQVEIFNLNGQLIHTERKNSAIFTILLPDILRGVYFYRLKSEHLNISGKIVKQ